jgi:hypothetical protein
MLALLRFSVRHPRVVIAACLLAAAAAALWIPRIELKLDGRWAVSSCCGSRAGC